MSKFPTMIERFVDSDFPRSDLLGWIGGKVTEAENTLKAREAMEATWHGGTDDSWKAVGCKLNRFQRLKESETHKRIAVKCRFELKMFKTVFDALSHPDTD